MALAAKVLQRAEQRPRAVIHGAQIVEDDHTRGVPAEFAHYVRKQVHQLLSLPQQIRKFSGPRSKQYSKLYA
jgi:hypothetical protein